MACSCDIMDGELTGRIFVCPKTIIVTWGKKLRTSPTAPVIFGQDSNMGRLHHYLALNQTMPI